MSTFQPGDWVIYRSYPGAPAEDGEVTEVRGDLVMVRYRGDVTAKATRPADLERATLPCVGVVVAEAVTG